MSEEYETKKAVRDLISHIESGAKDRRAFMKLLKETDQRPGFEDIKKWREFARFAKVLMTVFRKDYEKLYDKEYLKEMASIIERLIK